MATRSDSFARLSAARLIPEDRRKRNRSPARSYWPSFKEEQPVAPSRWGKMVELN